MRMFMCLHDVHLGTDLQMYHIIYCRSTHARQKEKQFYTRHVDIFGQYYLVVSYSCVV
jgi:hypothetical protein